MFTRLLGLTLLVTLFSAFSVVKAQDCSISLGDVKLVTDPADICDGQDLLYKVSGYPGSLFAFNFDGNVAGGFSTDSTVSVPEGTPFTVQVEIRTATDTCLSQILTVPNASMIEPVQIDTSEVEHPLCYGQSGEITIMYSGNHGPYTYYIIPDSVWNHGSFNLMTVNLANYQVYSPQIVRPAGSYWVALQDANSCIDLTLESNWDSTWVNPAPSQIVIADVVGVDPVCNGGDGTITVTVGSGGTPYLSGEYIVSVGTEMDTTSSLVASFDLPAGSYAVTVYDSLGCYTLLDSMVVLTDPDEVTFDISIEDVTCAEGANGIIYVTNFEGGSGTEYWASLGNGNWIQAVNDTVQLTGLVAGYYSVYVMQETSCDSVGYVNPNNTQNTIAVQAPSEITYTVSHGTITCNGGTTTISVNGVTGGVPPYQYRINGGSWSSGTTSTSKSWTGQIAGTYNIDVRDANQVCIISYPAFTIAQPSLVSLNFAEMDVISPTCFDGNDGIIKIAATGGNGTYQYSIDGTNWKTNNIFGVPAGTYTVYARDPLCTAQAVSTTVDVDDLDPNTLVLGNLADTVNDCYGVNDNEIIVRRMSWASQAGETRQLTVMITDNMEDIYVDGEEMTPVWSAGWTYRAYDVDPGTYYIWAVDNLGCVFDAGQDGVADYITVHVIEPKQLEVTGKVTDNATCYGENDGILTIKHNKGGNDDWYGYAHANTLQAALNLPNGAFTTWPTNKDSVNIQVGKGTYYVVVMDACDQKAYAGPFEVDGYDMVTIAKNPLDTTNIVCYGDSTGVIHVAAAQGGAGPLVYTLKKWNGSVWVNVTGYVNVSTTTYVGLKAGTYKVVVTDNGGCDGAETRNIMITGPASPVSFTANPTDITCNGASDGKITVTASGGVGKYQFKVGAANWRNFDASSPTVKVVVITEPGTYMVWVRDSLGCTAPGQEFTIEQPDAITIATTLTNVTSTCLSTPNGKIVATVSGGNTTEYVVQIPGLDTLSTTGGVVTFNNVPAGDYTIIAVDGTGCDGDKAVKITSPSTLAMAASVTENVLCNGGANGKITVTSITGGVPNTTAPAYTISISPNVGSINQTTRVISGLTAGTYTVTVTDKNGCTASKNNLIITQPTALALNATKIQDISCEEGGKFSLQVSGGAGGYRYYAHISELPEHVLVPDPTSAAWQNDSIITVTEAGTWIVWAIDVNGCVIGGEEDELGNPVNAWRVKVEEPEVVVTVDASVSGEPECNGDMTAMVWITPGNISIVEDGVPVTNPVYSVMINEVANDTVKNVGAGTYVVKVTHESGCFGTDTIVIEEPEVLEVVLDKGEGEFTCPEMTEGYIEATANGGAPALKGAIYVPYWYQLWQDGVLKTDYQEDNSFLVTIGHEYVVVVKDANGCTDTSNVMVLDPVAPVEIVDIIDVTCADDTLASALVTVVGEPGRQFRIHWDQIEAGLSDDGQTAWFTAGSYKLDQIFLFDNENIQDIHYAIWVEDEVGCLSAVDTLTFDQLINTPLATTATVGDVVGCATEIMVTATGGVSPYMVVVDDMDTVEFAATTTLMLGGGAHSVDVYDAHLCMQEYTFNLAYAYSVDTTFYIYPSEYTFTSKAHLVYEPAGLDTMLAKGSYTFYYELMEGCIAEIKVTVIESEGPVIKKLSPTTRIADNHPVFMMIFKKDVKLSDVGGYLTVTPYDSTEAVLTIELTPEMFAKGDTVIVDYDWTEVGKLDIKTRYFVMVDSAAIEGVVDGFAWKGIQDKTWVFNTGPDFPTDVNPELSAASFVVYPNPFENEINISNSDKLTRVIVTNIAGQKVLDVEYPEERIRTANLVSGVYFVSMFTDSGLAKTDKIVKR